RGGSAHAGPRLAKAPCPALPPARHWSGPLRSLTVAAGDRCTAPVASGHTASGRRGVGASGRRGVGASGRRGAGVTAGGQRLVGPLGPVPPAGGQPVGPSPLVPPASAPSS